MTTTGKSGGAKTNTISKATMSASGTPTGKSSGAMTGS